MDSVVSPLRMTRDDFMSSTVLSVPCSRGVHSSMANFVTCVEDWWKCPSCLLKANPADPPHAPSSSELVATGLTAAPPVCDPPAILGSASLDAFVPASLPLAADLSVTVSSFVDLSLLDGFPALPDLPVAS